MNAKQISASAWQRGKNLKRFLALPFVAILLVSLLALTVSADPGWDYYREIEIDSGKVSGSADLSSFPMLINLTADWLKYENMSGHVREEHGYDIVFTNEHNTTLLDFEIEEYNGTYNTTHGTLVAWVRIPALDHDDNTSIRLWYGNSQATDWSNPTGVWDSNYKLVQHLLEDPSGTVPQMKDSTSNGNNGTSAGSMTSSDQVTGQIDGSLDFDGGDDYVNFGNDNSLRPTSPVSVSVWANAGRVSGTNFIVSMPYAETGWPAPYLAYGIAVRGSKAVFFMCENGHYREFPAGNIATGEWHHLAVTYNGSGSLADSNIRGFIDGVETSEGLLPYPCPNSVLQYSGSPSLVIGQRSAGSLGEYFKGTIDEVRISNTARSGDWIATEYNNQHSPSTFYSVGGATSTGGSDPVPELPTAILFAVGLVVLAGYVLVGKRRKK